MSLKKLKKKNLPRKEKRLSNIWNVVWEKMDNIR